jgi:hypothetical protein
MRIVSHFWRYDLDDYFERLTFIEPQAGFKSQCLSRHEGNLRGGLCLLH